MRVILFVIFLSCIAWARPEVSFVSPVEVSQRSTLRLGDIVQVEEGTDELLATLDSIVLTSTTKIRSLEISALIKKEIEEGGVFKRLNVAFKIPNEVEIKKSASPISKIEVERRIVNILKARCGDCAYKVNVQSAPFPNGAEWDLDYSQVSSKGSFLIPVRDGNDRSLKWVSGSVRVSKLTPVATRLIQVGERIQTGDLKLASVDITFAKDSNVSIEQVQGQQLVRSLQMGQPVWSSDLKREPATLRGQMVKATLGDGDFEITTSLEAQESGFVGDTIKVKNIETQKVLSATIADKGVVKIQ